MNTLSIDKEQKLIILEFNIMQESKVYTSCYRINVTDFQGL